LSGIIAFAQAVTDACNDSSLRHFPKATRPG
jgi:hypothetical protein